MGDFWIISEKEAQILFLETTGSWAAMRTSLMTEPKPSLKLLYESVPTTIDLQPGATKQLRWALGAHMFSSLGIHSFVFPYERYKKLCRHYNKDPSTAFGFERYSDSDGTQLTDDYPRTIVNIWKPDEIPPKSTWFADMVRNSFAHGQTTLTKEGGKLGIAMFNTRDGTSVNFDVFVDLNDIGPLISTGLSNFIKNIVDGGTVEPLTTYLKNMGDFYK